MDEDRVAGAFNKVGGRIEGAVGDLTGDAGMQARGKTDEVIGQVQEGIGRARDGVRSAGAEAQAQLGTAGETLGALVREQPLAALATATVVGYLLALLIHRR